VRKLLLHPSVVEEISEAKNFYNSKVEELGNQLLDEINTAIKFIEESPETWPAYYINLHRFILKRFPFSIIYRIKDNEVQVIAFMHHRRKPLYWKKRIS
jgi:hypothetical protein